MTTAALISSSVLSLASGRVGFALIGALTVLYFPGHLSPIPLPSGAVWRIDRIQQEVKDLKEESQLLRNNLEEVGALLDAETKARIEANEIIAENDRENMELSARLDRLSRQAAENRSVGLDRTIEEIRDASPEWDTPIPDSIRDARLRQYCSARPSRADHPICRDSAPDE